MIRIFFIFSLVYLENNNINTMLYVSVHYITLLLCEYGIVHFYVSANVSDIKKVIIVKIPM